MPMLVTRQERIFAIDGDYIHVRYPKPCFFYHSTDLYFFTDYAVRQQG